MIVAKVPGRKHFPCPIKWRQVRDDLERRLAATSLSAAYAALCDVYVVKARESIRAAVLTREQRAHLESAATAPSC